jgi:hypothetical protein
MAPIEVVEAYYAAMGDLDHTLMEACVVGKAGRNDIDLVIHYFVLSKVRQAYEMNAPQVISAQRWIDAGYPSTESTVFGVSGFRSEPIDLDETGGEAAFRVSYLLWVPQQSQPSGAQAESDLPQAEEAAAIPISIPQTDTVKLVLRKDEWRIADIQRTYE